MKLLLIGLIISLNSIASTTNVNASSMPDIQFNTNTNYFVEGILACKDDVRANREGEVSDVEYLEELTACETDIDNNGNY